MVPSISTFRHWDHQWYIWLPGDPTYEAVEVMSADRGVAFAPAGLGFLRRARRARAAMQLLQRSPRCRPGRNQGVRIPDVPGPRFRRRRSTEPAAVQGPPDTNTAPRAR